MKLYKSQNSLNKYDFETFAFLECSKQNITPDVFFEIFTKAHDILNKKLLLSQEEVWIFLNFGIYLELDQIDMIDYMTKRMMILPKIGYIY